MMVLEWIRSKVSPGRMAWYFHDADHQWFVQSTDEERASEIAEIMLRKEGFQKDYIDSVKLHIMGTVFKQRGCLVLPEQQLIADADLSKLGSSYRAFVQNSINYLLEMHPKWEITDREIEAYFKHNQPWFFNMLTDITGKKETPFLTDIARVKFPNFSRNKDTLAQDTEENLWELISLVRKSEIQPHVRDFRQAA